MGYQQLLGVGGPPVASGPTFSPLGVNFNGTAYMSNVIAAPPADSATFLASVWIKTAGSVFAQIIDFGTFSLGLQISGVNGFAEINAFDSAFSSFVQFDSSTINDNAWHNVLAAADCSFAAGSKPLFMYVDDANVITGILDVFPAFVIGFSTAVTSGIGATHGGFVPFSGDMAELWFSSNQYLDLSVTSNRRKFITAGIHPVDLGSTGSTPTGTQPDIYCSVRAAGSATDFATNRGTKGNYTISGSLTLSSTNP